MSVEAFAVSTGIVALGEIGDKTQLLALVLAARFQKPLPIIAGILIATLANHTLAGFLGRVKARVYPVLIPSMPLKWFNKVLWLRCEAPL